MRYLPFYFTVLCLLFFSTAYSQASAQETLHRISDYPAGFYYTYKDFITKNARPALKVERRTVYGNQRIKKDSIVDHLFFFGVTDQYVITDVFAISYEGNLYFKQSQLTKYAKKGNRMEEGDNGNSYHRVIKDGRFFYMEGMFGNAWSKGFAVNAGVSASLVNRLKGAIFDFKDNKFDFLTNCEDFKSFLKGYNPEAAINCKEYNIIEVRKNIDSIIE